MILRGINYDLGTIRLIFYAILKIIDIDITTDF